MKPKSLVFILSYFLNLMATGCTVNHEIRLQRFPILNINHSARDLLFINNTDTAFLNINHSEDMGVRFDSYYEFKANLKNARYLIFVDDTLVEKQDFKNGQRHGIYRHYIKGAKDCEITYLSGKAYGKGKFYFKNGKINSVIVYENGSPRIRWTYNENRDLTREEFFIGNTVRLVDYDRAGRVKAIRENHGLLNSDPDTIGSLQSGKKVYRYKQGTFTVFYKKGKNKKWIFSPNKK